MNALDMVVSGWTTAAGDYNNNGGYATLPTATEAKIEPVSGYHITAFAAALPYGAAVSFKTGGSVRVIMSAIPNQATAAQAETLWKATEPLTISLGSDMVLAWGKNDPFGIANNRDSKILFRIYYR